MSDTTTQISTLTEIKAALKAALGTPQNNANSAATLAGTRFLATNAKGETVEATVLPTLSDKGKVRATLACRHPGCQETHVREQSDWHQSLLCHTHSGPTKAKLTDAEKLANKVAAAKAFLAANGQ